MTIANFSVTGYINTKALPELQGSIEGLLYWYEGLSNWASLSEVLLLPKDTALYLTGMWQNRGAEPISGHLEFVITRPDGSQLTLNDVLNQNNWAAPGNGWMVRFEPVVLDQPGTYKATLRLSTMGQLLDETSMDVAIIQPTTFTLVYGAPLANPDVCGAPYWGARIYDIVTQQWMNGTPAGRGPPGFPRTFSPSSTRFFIELTTGVYCAVSEAVGLFLANLPALGSYEWSQVPCINVLSGDPAFDRAFVTANLGGIDNPRPHIEVVGLQILSAEDVAGSSMNCIKYFVGGWISAYAFGLLTDGYNYISPNGQPLNPSRPVTAIVSIIVDGTMTPQGWEFILSDLRQLGDTTPYPTYPESAA